MQRLSTKHCKQEDARPLLSGQRGQWPVGCGGGTYWGEGRTLAVHQLGPSHRGRWDSSHLLHTPVHRDTCVQGHGVAGGVAPHRPTLPSHICPPGSARLSNVDNGGTNAAGPLCRAAPWFQGRSPRGGVRVAAAPSTLTVPPSTAVSKFRFNTKEGNVVSVGLEGEIWVAGGGMESNVVWDDRACSPCQSSGSTPRRAICICWLGP